MPQLVRFQDLPRFTSVRDSRDRLDLVNKDLFGMTDLKADQITFHPGDTAAPHRHPGAKHFFFILEGDGIMHAGDEVLNVSAGDVAMVFEDEVHWLENQSQANFRFIELWVPAPEGASVWVTDDQ